MFMECASETRVLDWEVVVSIRFDMVDWSPAA